MHQVIIMPLAETDVTEIVDYIAFELFAPETAERIRDGLYHEMSTLVRTSFPNNTTTHNEACHDPVARMPFSFLRFILSSPNPHRSFIFISRFV